MKKQIEVVAAIIVAGDTILATQKGNGEFKDLWEFPGGKIEVGESHEKALIREIKEELNIEIGIECLFKTISYEYPSFHLIMHCYLSFINSGEITLLEHSDKIWLSRKQLHELQWVPADIEVVNELANHWSIKQ